MRMIKTRNMNCLLLLWSQLKLIAKGLISTIKVTKQKYPMSYVMYKGSLPYCALVGNALLELNKLKRCSKFVSKVD